MHGVYNDRFYFLTHCPMGFPVLLGLFLTVSAAETNRDLVSDVRALGRAKKRDLMILKDAKLLFQPQPEQYPTATPWPTISISESPKSTVPFPSRANVITATEDGQRKTVLIGFVAAVCGALVVIAVISVIVVVIKRKNEQIYPVSDEEIPETDRNIVVVKKIWATDTVVP
jgi:hypothetical protein